MMVYERMTVTTRMYRVKNAYLTSVPKSAANPPSTIAFVVQSCVQIRGVILPMFSQIHGREVVQNIAEDPETSTSAERKSHQREAWNTRH